MNLGKDWEWSNKKLACKVRPESGNPSIDELRDRLSDMSGVPIPDAPVPKKSGKFSNTAARRSSNAGAARDQRPATAELNKFGTSGIIVAEFEDQLDRKVRNKIPAHQRNIHKK